MWKKINSFVLVMHKPLLYLVDSKEAVLMFAALICSSRMLENECKEVTKCSFVCIVASVLKFTTALNSSAQSNSW